MSSSPTNSTGNTIIEETNIWDLNRVAVRVVGELANIATTVAPASGAISMIPYSWGNYKGNILRGNVGDGLQLMYPRVNPVGMATFNSVVNSSYNSGVIEFDIDLELQIFVNNVWIKFTYPGMMVADAESMSSGTGSNIEYISAETNGTAWQIVDVRNEAHLF